MKPRRLDPSQWIEWEYERKEGNLSCYAPTLESAIETLKEHGFLYIDPKKLKKTDKLLSDVLKKEGIS